MALESMQPLHAFEVQVYVELHLGWLDLSITNTAVVMLLGVLLVFVLLRLCMHERNRIPGYRQSLAESYFCFIRNLTLNNIRHGERFVPLMFTLFSFILGCNLIGLLPGVFTPTSQIAVTATLAVMVFLYSVWLRIRNHGWGFVRAFVPNGIPVYLLPLMIPIEVLSFLARPLSLAVRLFANMTAGHTVLGVIAFFGILTPWFVQWVPMGLSVVLYAIELFIGLIQAYIFSILSCVYIDDAMQES
ncbi:MAG: F0F1 ATP synthase subunit A [Mariprofundus sp.]